MTTQTRVENLFGRELRKGLDSRFATMRLHVGPSRAVAAFAPGVLGSFLTRSDAPEMRILVEFQPHIGMAGFTRCAPDVIVFGLLLSSRDQRQGEYERESQRPEYGYPTVCEGAVDEHRLACQGFSLERPHTACRNGLVKLL